MGPRAHVRLDDPMAPPRARLRRAHRLFRSHDPRRSWKRPAQANSSRIGVFKRTLTPGTWRDTGSPARDVAAMLGTHRPQCDQRNVRSWEDSADNPELYFGLEITWG